MSRLIDITGQRFGHLTVLDRNGRLGTKAAWRCRCDCGRELALSGARLRRGQLACGCRLSRPEPRRARHGHNRLEGRSREYNSWAKMKQRCLNPNDPNFANYGGRGITICQRWIDSFEAFLADMGPRPAGRSLDRFPDPNGNYQPGNCRWATRREQNTNTRCTRFVDVGGKRVLLDDLAVEAARAGIPKNAFRMRIASGWSVERAMSTPLVSPGRPRNEEARV